MGMVLEIIVRDKWPDGRFRKLINQSVNLRFMVHGSWLMAHGSWLMAHGSWPRKERGPGPGPGPPAPRSFLGHEA